MALGKNAYRRIALHHHQGADILFIHLANAVEHGFIGADGPDLAAFLIQQLLYSGHGIASSLYGPWAETDSHVNAARPVDKDKDSSYSFMFAREGRDSREEGMASCHLPDPSAPEPDGQEG